ncbi:type II toxin-antitoxin system RelE/ParE family toxin [Sphingomonas nostoxanthinifaciens]|uniref:type II toxin-antitoxin system RelE/ParE family toxin n=1 Tax=Sphingomonas nostoxanthinifaciens TaxID=2872652 RepID=UPI001CC1F39C|nr:type II toxin-antitoxin system RelE/ParE family toxin [Sphingomonas nostoxanthinifaciens]UAK24167.1 type II toxin-antitoxin system RelE/ParE family toxin [Sphingomonas nostoxanthinifaciens]
MKTKQTPLFAKWLKGLKDQRAARAVTIRIARVEAGLLGDVKFFDGIGELRIDVGPGYRVYFVKRGNEWVILLNGGDKNSQERDIRKAKELAAGLD